MHIYPFQPLVPASDDAAAAVTCPHYDTYTPSQLQGHLRTRPHSFMSVMRPDAVSTLLPSSSSTPSSTSNPDTTLAHSAHRSLSSLLHSSLLIRDDSPQLYLYRLDVHSQSHDGSAPTLSRSQVGVISAAKLSDYDDSSAILAHEQTRLHKERNCTDFLHELGANPGGPVFLTYEDVPLINALIADILAVTTPFLYVPPTAAAADGSDGLASATGANVTHYVYRVPPNLQGRLRAAFSEHVPLAYIADGHHRAKSMSNVARRRGMPADQVALPVALFPKSHLRLSSFVRVVSGLAAASVLSLLRKRLGSRAVTPIPAFAYDLATRTGEVFMYTKKQWYAVALPTYKAGAGDEDEDSEESFSEGDDDPCTTLDCNVLQKVVIDELLAGDAPAKLKFISTAHISVEDVAKKVDRNHVRDGAACAFVLKPVSVDDVMKVADANQSMPPKSTSFEPKLRCGFFTHTF